MKMTARHTARRRDPQPGAGEVDMAAPTPAPATIDQVRSAPLFAGLDGASVTNAARSFEEAHFLPGHRMVVEGLRGSDFYLIVAGRASVLVDNWRVAKLGPGDFFGEVAILGDGHRSASVRADTPLHCLVLSNGGLEQLLLDHPRLGVNMLRALVERFRGVAERQGPPASEVLVS